MVQLGYKVYDDYDLDMEQIGRCCTISQVRKVVNERISDTDGECYILVEDVLTGDIMPWEDFIEEHPYEA